MTRILSILSLIVIVPPKATSALYLETLGTTFGASLNTSYTYDSNIEGRADSPGGAIGRITPQLSFAKEDGVIRLDGLVSASFSRYINVGTVEFDSELESQSSNFIVPKSGDTFNDHDAQLTARLNQWNDFWSASLTADLNESNNVDRIEGGIIRTREYGLSGRLNYRVGSRTSLSMIPTFRVSENQDFSDNQTLGIAATVNYDYNDALIFSIGGDYRDSTVDSNSQSSRELLSLESAPNQTVPSPPATPAPPIGIPPPGPTTQTVERIELLREERSQDSNDYSVFISATGDLTPTITGSATVGLRQREFADPTRSSEGSTYFDVSLQWALSTLTSLNFTLGQDFSNTASGRNEESLNTSLSASRNISPQLTGIIRVGYTKNRIGRTPEDLTLITTTAVIPINRNPEEEDLNSLANTTVRTQTVQGDLNENAGEDEEWQYGIGLAYRFTRLGSLSADLSYYDRSSDRTDGAEFSSYTFSLSHSYQF